MNVFALVMEDSVRDASDNKFAAAHLKALTHRKNRLLIPASNPPNTLSCPATLQISHGSDSGYYNSPGVNHRVLTAAVWLYCVIRMLDKSHREG